MLTNRSSRPRRLSVTAYVEWVLGPSRSATLPFVSTEIDAATGAMFARNPWNASFGSRVAFADLRAAQTSWTGDRREFIGRNGTLAEPAALSGAAALSKTVGAGLDPCAALSAKIELAPGQAVEVVFFLGEAKNDEAARDLVARYRAADLDAVEAEVERQWDDILGSVVVKTPDRSMDVMLNGWLLYQTLSCRVWARSGFYQASGAYGFRDQLQDGMALAATRPRLDPRASPARRRRDNSSKAMSSIGGCRIRVRACEPASRTIVRGSPMPSPITSRSPATSPSSTRGSRSWKARRSSRANMTASSIRPSPMRPRPCSSIALSLSTPLWRSACMGFP